MQSPSTLHVVLWDDTLSMADHWKEEGGDKNSFQESRRFIKEIARRAAQVDSAQRFAILRLSRCEPPEIVFNERLNEQSRHKLEEIVDDSNKKCSLLRVRPLKGVQAARDFFDANPAEKKLLHIISDFRQADWNVAEKDDALRQALDNLSDKGVIVHKVDMAQPSRSDQSDLVLNHDNVAVIELRPESAVVARDKLIQFTVEIANYSPSERKDAVSQGHGERYRAPRGLAATEPVPRPEQVHVHG